MHGVEKVIIECSVNKAGLSKKYKMLVSLCCTGMSQHQIADQLNISVNTLKSYKKAITSKKKVAYISQLICYDYITEK